MDRWTEVRLRSSLLFANISTSLPLVSVEHQSEEHDSVHIYTTWFPEDITQESK